MQARGIFLLAAVAFGLLAFSSEVLAQTDKCAERYVFRDAFPGDRVCVTVETRDMVADENRNADKFRKKDGNGECEFGYVWRMAGPQDKMCVTQDERDQAQQDNGLASTRVASRSVTRRPNPAPPMPPKAGCFNRANDTWEEVACVPEEYVKRNFPPPTPQYSILSNRRLVDPHVGTWFAPRIRLGSVEITHLSDPAIGTLTDSLYGKDAFSVQVNTNFFKATNGNTGWVQFVLQSKPDDVKNPADDDILCVWQVDVTVAMTSSNTMGYTPTCVFVPKQRTVWTGPSVSKRVTFIGPGADMNERVLVAGYVSEGGVGSNLLAAWALVPWAPFKAYSVAVADKYGMLERWTEVSGGIMGFGLGSQANFSRTQIRTVLEAKSCVAGGADFSCPKPFPPRLNFGDYATSSITSVTAETNDLSSTYNFTFHPPEFSCVEGSCTLDYSSGPFSSIYFTGGP